jgi:hypothetical protein
VLAKRMYAPSTAMRGDRGRMGRLLSSISLLSHPLPPDVAAYPLEAER